MKKICDNKEFWDILESLIDSSEIIIDRKKGSCHPKIKTIIYPVDYGYLDNTQSSDGEGIDIWIGTNNCGINGIICTCDSFQKDSEIKILYKCTDEEIEQIFKFTNERQKMKGIMFIKD